MDNRYVNTASQTAEERGVTFIQLNPNFYTGTEAVSIQIIAEQWHYSPFWEDLLHI